MKLPYFLIFCMVMVAQAQPPPPGPNTPTGGPIVPPGGFPIDNDLAYLIIVAVVYGVFVLLSSTKKTHP